MFLLKESMRLRKVQMMMCYMDTDYGLDMVSLHT